MEDALQRFAKAGGVGATVRDAVNLAVIFERSFAREDLAEDGDVLARSRERLTVRNAVPSFDHLRTGRAEPDDGPASAERVERHRGHGRHRGRACRHLEDAGAEPYGLGSRTDPGERDHRVGTVGFGGPYRAVAELLGFEDEIED